MGTPNGKFVLNAVRDRFTDKSQVVVYEVVAPGATTVEYSLQYKGNAMVGSQPRHMALNEDGLVVTANQMADSVSILRMDYETGDLSRLSEQDLALPVGLDSPVF